MKPEFPVLHGFVHESRHTGHWETSCSFLLFLLQDVKEPLKERIVLGYIRIVQSNGFFRSRPPGGRGGEVKHLKRRWVSPFSVKDRDHLQILSVVHKYISKPEIVAINLNGPWSYLLSTK